MNRISMVTIMMRPLWERALESRRLEQEAQRAQVYRENGRKGGFAKRKHRELAVGQRFGAWTVVNLIGRGVMGRSDMRVEIVCVCGKRAELFEFMVRKKVMDGPICRHFRPGRP